MLGFVSFFVVLVILSGAVGLMVTTIRDSADSVLAALFGAPKPVATVIALPRRPIRQLRPASPYYAPLRAAA